MNSNDFILCGVYKILCSSNNKVYIGSSKNIDKRLALHLKTLRKNKHRNPHLQSAFNLHGESSFSFHVIELTPPEKQLEREQHWMDTTLCYDRLHGFNNTKKADRPEGYRHTPKTRDRMSKIKKEQLASGKIKSNLIGARRPVFTEERKAKLSQAYTGKGNPMYGYKEPEEKKRKRMKNMLAKERWNKGLTKFDDPRLAEMAKKKLGQIPSNAQKCRLTNVITGEEWEDTSLTRLGKSSPLSPATITRLKNNTAGQKITTTYKLEIL